MLGTAQSHLLAALLLTVVNYLALTGYDFLAFRYIGKTLAWWRIAVASFLAYAIANNVGFAMLSGTSVRYRFYTRWGVTAEEYMRLADPWPLNPDGALLFGLKIENPRADANVGSSVRVPGIAFAEWGPGDHGFYIMGRPGTYTGGGEAAPQMAAVRRRVLNATKAAGIRFLNACTEETVVDQLKDGVMICTGGDTPAADKGRAFTKRTDPW